MHFQWVFIFHKMEMKKKNKYKMTHSEFMCITDLLLNKTHIHFV